MKEAKAEIISRMMIYPSSPTPVHLKHFKICLLDQLSHSFYLPLVLFYSASDISKASPTNYHRNFAKLSQKLKNSLSEALPVYYPFSGRIKEDNRGNVYIDCNDQGVLYLEAKIPSTFSDFLKNCNNNPHADEIKGFLPLDPYNPNPHINGEDHPLMMAVQVSECACGSIVIGACISHKICDGTTAVSFLKVWCQEAIMGHDESEVAFPNMEASLIFPPKEKEIIDVTSEMINVNENENLLTKRFLFSGDILRRLRDEISGGCNFKPTRVESLTALLWKCAMDAEVTVDPTHDLNSSSMLLQHAVNIRSRTVPPLPQNSIGNLWQFAVSPLLEVDKVTNLGLQDVVEIVRDTIRKVDGEYVSNLQGEAKGLNEILKSMEQVLILVKNKGVPCYTFSSWASFGVFEADFGWGKPTWTCALAVPIKNVFIFMPTRSGDGIEAWITLEETRMLEFQKNPQLLQFASFDL